MEPLIKEEFECIDETAALIYGSTSSTLPPDLLKEQCEVDSKQWFVKTEPASPVRDSTDVDRNSEGITLECELSLKKLFEPKVNSPAWEHEEELSINPSGLSIEPCEADSKVWYVKTEAASPGRDVPEIVQDPAGIKMECDPSLKMLIKREVTSPARDSQHVEEHEEESPPGLDNESLKMHADLTHKKIWTFQCPHCDYKTDRKNKLKNHIDLLHKMVFQWVLSQYKSNTKKKVKNRIKKVMAFKCTHCKYKTNKKKILKIHMDTVHLQIFKCPHCDYKTNRKDFMEKHMDSMHKKVKAFLCSLCDYYSNSKFNLKMHNNTVHLKIMALQCHHCDYKTIRKDCMKYHIDTVHLKIWAFKCPHCDYKTNRKIGMKNHIDTVHLKIWAFKCPHCDYKTNRKDDMKRHSERRHI